MKSKVGRAVSILLAVLVSGALFYLALRGVRLGEVAALLSQVRPLWIPALLLMPLLDLWVRAARWRLLLAPMAETSVGKLFQLETVGLGMNNLVFLRLGELARGYLTSKELGIPMTSSLASILVERLCDTIALLTLFSVSAFMLPGLIDIRVRYWALASAVLLTLILAALAAGDARLKRERSWLRRLKPYPRLHLLAEELMIGGRCLRVGRAAAWIAALSLALWICDAGLFWVAAHALSFDPPLAFSSSVAVVACAAGASALPALPGSFGNFEAAVRYILVHFGYATYLAIAYAALAHLCAYLVVTGLGIACFHRLGYTLSSLLKALEKK